MRPSGRSKTRTGARAVLSAVFFVAPISAGPERAEADGIITVSVDVVEPAFWPDLAQFEVTVGNLGTESLTSVNVIGTEPQNADFVPGVTDPPAVVVGNDDAVLDPGEVWRFSASGQHIHGYAEVLVTARTAWGATVSALDRFDYYGLIREPVIGTVRPAVESVAEAGDPMDWTVELANVSASSLMLRVYQPPGFGLGLGAGTGDVDGDGLMDPGEVWRWVVTTTIASDCTWIVVNFSFKGAASNLYGSDAASSPVRIGAPTEVCPDVPRAVPPPPVTSHVTSLSSAVSPQTAASLTQPTTSSATPQEQGGPVLAETGVSSRSSSVLGAATLITGGVLVLISRRRPPSRTFG